MKKIILICFLLTIPLQSCGRQDAVNGSRNPGTDVTDPDAGKNSGRRTQYVSELDNDLVIFPQVTFPDKHDKPIWTILSTKDFVQDKKVLDIGTGCGILGLIALKHGAKSVVGTDIIPKAVENAVTNAKMLGYGNAFEARLVPFDRPEAYSVIKADEKFDLIISTPPWSHREGRFLVKSIIDGLKQHLTEKGKSFILVAKSSGVSLILKLAQEHGLRAKVIGPRNPFVKSTTVVQLEKMP